MKLPLDLWKYVMQFLCNQPKKLRGWVPKERLKWDKLSGNPAASELIKETENTLDFYLLDWEKLASNPRLFDSVMKYFMGTEKEKWKGLSANPAAIKVLHSNRECICWNTIVFNTNPMIFDRKSEYNLCDDIIKYVPEDEWSVLLRNPAAIELIRELIYKNILEPDSNTRHINFEVLFNPNISMLDKEIVRSIVIENADNNMIWVLPLFLEVMSTCHMVDITEYAQSSKFSKNPAAVEFLKNNTKYIYPRYLSRNPAAVDFLKENPSYIDPGSLFRNRSSKAVELIVDRQYHPSNYWLAWRDLSANPAMIMYNDGEIIRNNFHLVYWDELSKMPELFMPDFVAWKKLCDGLACKFATAD